MSSGVPDPRALVDPKDIMFVALFEPAAELRFGPVDGVRKDPSRRNASVESPLEHDPGKPAFGGEAHVLGHTGFSERRSGSSAHSWGRYNSRSTKAEPFSEA